MKSIKCLSFFVTILVFSGAALSDEIYRCGKVYQNVPCAGGKPIDTTSAVEGYTTPKPRQNEFYRPSEADVVYQSGRSAECRSINEEISLIDRDALLAHPTSYHNSLRVRRQSLIDQRQKLVCSGSGLQ